MMCAEDCHMRKTLFGAVFTLLLAAVGLAAGSGLGTKVRVLVALANVRNTQPVLGAPRANGYWVEANPVKTDNPAILATSYVKKGRTLISLDSWSLGPATARLNID
jgi:hypothetical protein